MNSRLDLRDKQRKINKVYNISIVVVIILIVMVAITIFSGKDDKQISKEPKQSMQKEKTTKENSENTTGTKNNESINQKVVDKKDTKPVLEKVEGSGDGNVLNTYESKEWKPVGTKQTGTHTTSYEKGSTDWNEMTKAIAYGAGLNEASMRLWWLKNGGTSNTAIGTVSEGDNPQAYRVYIEWVDGEGWKPVKVEELKENDKGQ